MRHDALSGRQRAVAQTCANSTTTAAANGPARRAKVVRLRGGIATFTSGGRVGKTNHLDPCRSKPVHSANIHLNLIIYIFPVKKNCESELLLRVRGGWVYCEVSVNTNYTCILKFFKKIIVNNQAGTPA